ncbi:hypothetical protein DFP98_11486 [Cohnella phaseoli]|uniref:Uncharacterized protein n=1 Tax=Cohnella phaseoli TaxID=456490 RepID=A0A3D9JP32_9BACL|nr:hypothetical protein DFP98_11486 [Cohnella phaseoli]
MKEYQPITDQLDRLLSDYLALDKAVAGMAVGIVYNHQP